MQEPTARTIITATVAVVVKAKAMTMVVTAKPATHFGC